MSVIGTFPPSRLWEEKASAEFCGPHFRWGAHEHHHVWRVQNGEWRLCWELTAKTQQPASCAFKQRLPHSRLRATRCRWLLARGPLDIGKNMFCFPDPLFSLLYCSKLSPHPQSYSVMFTVNLSFLLRFLFWLVKVSLVHESFLDLSLPVLDDQVRLLSSFYLSRFFSCLEFMGEPCHLLQASKRAHH